MNLQEEEKNKWIDEYHKGVRYGLSGKVLIDQESEFQRIRIIKSERYGKGLLLDDCWMTAEHQEHYYHECLVHPALSSSKNRNSGSFSLFYKLFVQIRTN